jgi:putative serine protease PepD
MPSPGYQISRRPMRLMAWWMAALLVAAATGVGAYFGGRAAAGSTPSASATEAEPVAVVAASLLPTVVELETAAGLGAGFVYDSNGLIMTAAHVVSGSTQVTVRFSDGTTVTGQVVGADTNSDVGVVRVDRSGLAAAPLASGVTLEVGQMAIAIGSPFGLAESVTSGVVSGVDRAVTGSDNITRNLIQTDTPLNPGNSGGPLADRAGQVIGINDSIFTESGGNEGIGFAIPIDNAVSVARQLVAGQTPQMAVLGVGTTDSAPGQPPGALVTSVAAGSAAAAAGLQNGDLITAFNGQPVTGPADLLGDVHAQAPGDQVTLTVQRNGQEMTITVTLGGS